MTFDSAKIRAIASASIPPNAPSRAINHGNKVWGPRLKAFKDAVWPEDILALLDENDSLRAEVERLRKDGRELIAVLNRITVALNEAEVPSSPIGVEDRAIWAIKQLARSRSIGKDGGNG